MKVKTNVFVNGERFPDDLEEWLNDIKDEGRLAAVTVVERREEPMRVVAHAILDEEAKRLGHLVKIAAEHEVDLAGMRTQIADIEAETKIAHEEVGALVSIVLEVHRLTTLTALTDAKQIDMIKETLTRCIEPHKDGGTVVNLTKLLPPQG